MYLICKKSISEVSFNNLHVKKLKERKQKEKAVEETSGVTQEGEWYEYSSKFQT